jgi:hypothetical protein
MLSRKSGACEKILNKPVSMMKYDFMDDGKKSEDKDM